MDEFEKWFDRVFGDPNHKEIIKRKIERLTTENAKLMERANNAEAVLVKFEQLAGEEVAGFNVLQAENAKILTRLSNAFDEIAKLRDTLERIDIWVKAYPLDVFPKPDLNRAAEVLRASGITLDAISADAMRQVLDGIKNIVEQALKEDSDG